MIRNFLEWYRGPKWLIVSIIIPLIKWISKIPSEKFPNNLLPIYKLIVNLTWGWTLTVSLLILVIALSLWDPHYRKWIWNLKKYETWPSKKGLLPIELNDGKKIISASWGVLGDNKELIHVLKDYVADKAISIKATKEIFGDYPYGV